MRSGSIVLALISASALHAQTSVETGGGMARLDHYSGGAFSSFRGQVNQNYGAFRLAFMNTTVEHRGLGTAYRTDLTIGTSFMVRDWEISVGPELHLARGVEMPGTHTLSARLGFNRDFGAFRFSGTLQRGAAWADARHNRWTVGEFGVSTQVGAFKLGSTLHALALSDSVPRNDVSFDLRDPRLDTLYRERTQHLQDLGFSLGWSMGRVSFNAMAGERFGSDFESRSFWTGDLAVRVASSLAITVNTSRLPPDQLLRLHGGQFTSLGLRIGGVSGNSRKVPARIDPLAVEIVSASEMVTVRFAIPGARNSATISGEFSNWQPVELNRLEDGRWEAKFKGGAGLYRMNIRADGGAWTVPPGLRTVADDFGGVVGLLVVPERQ